MKTYFKSAVRFAASFLGAAVMLVACNPDLGPEDPGKDPQKDPEYLSLVDSLETVMFKQAKAMQLVLVGEDVLISSCSQTQDEGVYEISLTSGESFRILLDDAGDYVSAMAYIEEEGVKYWAVSDKEGDLAPVLNAEGAKVPLASILDVKVIDKEFVLKADGISFKTGYKVDDMVQMFSCTLLADDEGTVYAVKFIFGDSEKVVYVSEYSGLYFYLPSDQDKTPVSQMYVNKQGKATLAVNLPAEISWDPVVPHGWTAVYREAEGVAYVDVTAPEKYEITEENQPQLMAKSPDGSFAFATVDLTNKQFKALAISVTDVVITPSTGLGKYAYGITLLSDYDADVVRSLAEGLITGETEAAAGTAVSEGSVTRTFADVLGAELDSEARYVLWAYADGVLNEMEFGEIAISINVENIGLLDAQVNVKVNGANSIFGGLIEKSDDMKEIILYQVANQIFDPVLVDQRFEYAGAASDFPVVDSDKSTLMPDSEYAIWVVPVVEGEYSYTEKDIVIEEFKTNDVTGGGSLEIVCGEPVVTPSTISFPISCEGASMIYYAYLRSAGGKLYSNKSDAVKFEQIVMEDSDDRIGNYTAVVGNKVDALGTNLNDEKATEYWLYAVAVDSEGRYGKVHCVSASTLDLAYDTSISLAIETLDITSTKATFKVTSTGGDLSDYIYWFGRTTDPFWFQTAYLGATVDKAQKYMALNPGADQIDNAMRKYGKLASDGIITFDSLTPSESEDAKTYYRFVIMEKGKTYYSKAASKQISTLSVDLGNVVREGTDKWNEAFSKIEIEWHKDKFENPPHLQAYYSFDFKCPKDLTAYVFCAGEGYYEEVGFTKMEQFMIDIETYSSRRIDKDHVPYENEQPMQEPDYYKNGVYTEGQLMSVNDFYVHGSAKYGAFTFFAENSHKEGNCTSWKNGKCENYDRALSMLEYYRSLEPYQSRAKSFGLTGKEAEDWALALQAKYAQYYSTADPIIYINDGSPVTVVQASALGVDQDGLVPDRVFVMFKDLQGNYYEPMEIEVPNYFQ